MPNQTNSKPNSENIAHDAETSLANAELARERAAEALAESSSIDAATAEKIAQAESAAREATGVVEPALPTPAASHDAANTRTAPPVAATTVENVLDTSDLAALFDQVEAEVQPNAATPSVVEAVETDLEPSQDPALQDLAPAPEATPEVADRTPAPIESQPAPEASPATSPATAPTTAPTTAPATAALPDATPEPAMNLAALAQPATDAEPDSPPAAVAVNPPSTTATREIESPTDAPAISAETTQASPTAPTALEEKLNDLLGAVAKSEASLDAATGDAPAAATPAPALDAPVAARATPKPILAPALAAAIVDVPAAESTANNIESLDADLAALTETLLAADATGAAPDPEPTATESTASVAPTPSKPATVDQPTTPSPASTMPAAPSASASPKPTAASSAALAQPAAANASSPGTASASPTAPAISSPTPAALKPSVVKVKSRQLTAVTKSAAASLAPLVIQGLGLLSIPLRSKPKVVRDVIGIVGLWTLNLAALAWFYTIFLYKAPVPAPATPPVELHGGTTAAHDEKAHAHESAPAKHDEPEASHRTASESTHQPDPSAKTGKKAEHKVQAPSHATPAHKPAPHGGH